jgi:hypothetical protein
MSGGKLMKLIIVLRIAALGVAFVVGFYAGHRKPIIAHANSPLPARELSAPKSWGSLRSADGQGFFTFEDSNGTVRMMGLDGGLQVEIVRK